MYILINMCFEGIYIVSLKKTYVCEGSILGTPVKWTQMSSASSRFREAFWVNKLISFCVVTRHHDMEAISCRRSGENVLVVTCYCGPFKYIDLVLKPLDTLLNAYPNDIILVGDFNTKLTIWGQRYTDPIGCSLIAFASNAESRGAFYPAVQPEIQVTCTQTILPASAGANSEDET